MGFVEPIVITSAMPSSSVAVLGPPFALWLLMLAVPGIAAFALWAAADRARRSWPPLRAALPARAA
jgi:hypothetical protein